MPLAHDTKTVDTRVARMMAGRVVLLVAEMIGHSGRSGPHQNGFGQFFEQSVFPDDIPRASCSWSAVGRSASCRLSSVLPFSNFPMAVYTGLFTASFWSWD
jgi:hypothetical protein